MHSIDTNFYFISNLLNEKNKTVHEDILLGALKLPMKINYTEESGKHLQKNQLIISSLMKEFQINLVKEQKKKLSQSVNQINQRLNEIKYQKFNHQAPQTYQMKIKPLKIPKQRNYSKLNNEEEEGRLENDAKNFIKKLQRDKITRKNTLKEKQMKVNMAYFKSIENSLQELQGKFAQNLKLNNSRSNTLNKKSASYSQMFTNKPVKENKSQYYTNINTKRGSDTILPLISKPNELSIINNQNIYENLSNGEINVSVTKAYYANLDVTGGKNTILETSGIKKSPYYFNEPKYNKIIEIKEKFGNKIKMENPNSSDNTLLLNEL